MPAARLAPPAGLLRLALVLVLLTLPGACTTVLTRSAVPEELLLTARPYGIEAPLLRFWGDDWTEEDTARVLSLRRSLLNGSGDPGRGSEVVGLALSGGGPDGAFGAGLLAGWTERGDRPEFGVVSGVSTGAIIALFAFLGPDYDGTLREIYTDYTTEDLVTRTIFAGLTGGTALLDTRKYRALIERYVTDDVVARIAAGARDRRVLLIGTTNIDASRPMIWNVTSIANSGHPQARRLIHDVLQASSAIPAAFPPVLIPVIGADGRRYDEMHVDGGATQQVMLYSPELSVKAIDEALGERVHRSIYVVMNNKLTKPYAPVRPRLFSIAGTAASSLIGGSSGGDIYRIFAVAERDRMDLNVIAIPTEFDVEAEELFDPRYMAALYELGYEQGLAGDKWIPHPPDYLPRDEAEAQIANLEETQ